MAAPLRLDTPATSTTATPAADRQQWWADVQFGVSAMLTEAARGGASERRAG